MNKPEDRMFELFIEWYKKENTNYNHDWVFTKNKVYMDGVDITADIIQWMHLKLDKGETDWLKN